MGDEIDGKAKALEIRGHDIAERDIRDKSDTICYHARGQKR
jgi:hypothetical protein